ncbi:MAG: hypothetical protein ACJZ69_00105 [Pelagibacteraceae bacterium]
MLLIKHRVNTINQLKKTPVNLGVEIDLRSKNKKIYLHHDPFKKGVDFKKWVKYFKHKFIVLNVKEEGLENEILKILKKTKIKNQFFFHDQTFSSLIKNMKKTNVSIRYSEFEEIKNKKYIFNNIKWVWIDHFTKFPLDRNLYKYLNKRKVKICIVSPELIKKQHRSKIKNLKRKLTKNKIQVDAVCTKIPNFWTNKK